MAGTRAGSLPLIAISLLYWVPQAHCGSRQPFLPDRGALPPSRLLVGMHRLVGSWIPGVPAAAAATDWLAGSVRKIQLAGPVSSWRPPALNHAAADLPACLAAWRRQGGWHWHHEHHS